MKNRKCYANVVAVLIKFCALNSRLLSLHQAIQGYCFLCLPWSKPHFCGFWILNWVTVFLVRCSLLLILVAYTTWLSLACSLSSSLYVVIQYSFHRLWFSLSLKVCGISSTVRKYSGLCPSWHYLFCLPILPSFLCFLSLWWHHYLTESDLQT